MAGASGCEKTCPECGFRFEYQNGILCALPQTRRQVYARFIDEYSKIRELEGRGSESAAYYLALPYRDLTGRNKRQWMIRGTTYAFFESRILPQFGHVPQPAVLDLGAGTGWLSYRLAKRRCQPVAVDLLANPNDGLGAARHFQASMDSLFPLVLAEFDNLPFSDAQFDIAIFNSSLHYSINYVRTLEEARRCLKPAGKVVVLDSPIYRRREHGEQMREERHRHFETQFGFRSDSIPSQEFLYDDLLLELARDLGLRWRVYRPWYGWRWHLRPWQARLKRSRPPSRFHILVGSWAS
jgi:SAM-dependent methyltransferase